MEIKPKYFDHPDRAIRCIEWYAIRNCLCNRDDKLIRENLPQYDPDWVYWQETYNQKAKPAQRALMRAINDGTHKSLDECYDAMASLLKPRARGKALKDKKVRTAQAAYQKEQLGDAFIENEALMAAARKCAFELSEARATEDDVAVRAFQLETQYSTENPLSGPQRETLIQFLQQKIDKHLRPDTIEAQILDEDDKNLYFMWGKIKRLCPKGDTIAWPSARAAKEAHCSKADVKPIMRKLEAIGAVKLLQAGKSGANSKRAALYRREV